MNRAILIVAIGSLLGSIARFVAASYINKLNENIKLLATFIGLTTTKI